MRDNLPRRRFGLISHVPFRNDSYDISFNFHPSTARIVECFYSRTGSVKQGSDIDALLTDACIAVSLLLRHGASLSSLAEAFGENRGFDNLPGPPSSVLGAIARAGAALEKEFPIDKLTSDIIPMFTGGSSAPDMLTNGLTSSDGRPEHPPADRN